MCCNDCNVTILRVGVVQRRILLDRQVQYIILMCRERSWKAADMRSFDLMLVQMVVLRRHCDTGASSFASVLLAIERGNTSCNTAIQVEGKLQE